MAKLDNRIGNKKIVLFGGSFDPVHLGHVKMLEYCQENFNFDSIDIIPAQLSPFKDEYLFSAKQRLEFLEKAFDYDNISINTTELDREGPSYTSLTVKEYRAKYPDAELFMLLGSDNILGLKEWNDFDYLKENLSFIIFNRPEYRLPDLEKLGIKYYLVENFDFMVSSTQIKEQLKSQEASHIKSARLFDGLIPVAVQGLLLEYYVKQG